MLGFVRLRNVSSTACRAGGRPALRIFDLNGRRLPTRERSLSARQVGLTEVRTVAPGTRVALMVVVSVDPNRPKPASHRTLFWT